MELEKLEKDEEEQSCDEYIGDGRIDEGAAEVPGQQPGREEEPPAASGREGGGGGGGEPLPLSIEPGRAPGLDGGERDEQQPATLQDLQGDGESSTDKSGGLVGESALQQLAGEWSGALVSERQPIAGPLLSTAIDELLEFSACKTTAEKKTLQIQQLINMQINE